MANITSVSTTVEQPNMTGPMLFIVIGAFMFLGGLSSKNTSTAFFGAIFAALGYFWYRGRKPIWHLRISSASGETTPLHSINQQWIASIAQAINEAIIHRV
jgi:O-antigen/teichoic acid export membrane protein